MRTMQRKKKNHPIEWPFIVVQGMHSTRLFYYSLCETFVVMKTAISQMKCARVETPTTRKSTAAASIWRKETSGWNIIAVCDCKKERPPFIFQSCFTRTRTQNTANIFTGSRFVWARKINDKTGQSFRPVNCMFAARLKMTQRREREGDEHTQFFLYVVILS